MPRTTSGSKSRRSRQRGAIANPALGKRAPRARVAAMMCAWEAAEASHSVPADQHDDPAMIRYLAAAQEFQAEFGYPFSGGDGWDPHFKRMAFHASVAKALRRRFDHDVQKIEAEMSKPRYTCIVCNPFSEGDPRREDLELKLRQTKLFHEGADAVARLPASTNPRFPLSLRVPRNPNGYYDSEWSHNVVQAARAQY
ncbi:hypothetical protein DFH06DRAFT_1148488 [Mycena polygramma]|nr:hypothetical protein DFH06DRAFT_1152667 [Mycena polygramma]KAJ7602867.1 hypothetical protein DFH06DRAFT_1152541 [Mycena polygramma]KAJ7609372.1 hypothetical protein DFH06DRAFT_1148488 [Mycena polygramma]